ncbi:MULTISPECIES: GntR family transcriptional regulator [Lysinibacillus]|jgi:GntR family transcriptional regulator|uniref:GntR family transcriptional regulator n=1 Tax=Lysinibacillus TaxID=400634 RepID=UPI0004D7F94B|nr:MULTISPECIES: GntR family transcriptional regulator [Lysinibacillus]AJK88761.1 GntR family transcriptional regulator [Lysinibacillus fusiformis]KGA83036.1 GntR family transcriptional regulator [Lysinibacillus fusiformis]KHK48524.1 GntR family transcriptional regulator [Lysinibacillus sp. A1]MCK1987124.1 GntR family transcriptional regulator [Lysinibacillus fusiformis]WEA40508.1 GntR family transcriptional regulator [Lysinibacillus fusiformis]
MNLKVNRTSKVPLYQQLNERLLLAIITGNLKKGDHLPSIRNLASQTNLNLHTVHKSYKELQKSGIITIKPPSKAIVMVDSGEAISISLQQISIRIEHIIIESSILGINEIYLRQMFEGVLQKYYNSVK